MESASLAIERTRCGEKPLLIYKFKKSTSIYTLVKGNAELHFLKELLGKYHG